MIGSQHCSEQLRIDDPGIETMLACNAQPLFEPRELRFVLRQVKRSALSEADVAKLLAQFQPQLQAAHHHGQLDGGTALLPHPAPVSSRLLAGDPAFLEERDAQAFACEE